MTTKRPSEHVVLHKALWLEVDCSPDAAVHVEGHRLMLMGYPPLAVDLAEAEGHASPHFGFLASVFLPLIRFSPWQ